MLSERLQALVAGVIRLAFHNDVLLLAGVVVLLVGVYERYGRSTALMVAGGALMLMGLATAKR